MRNSTLRLPQSALLGADALRGPAMPVPAILAGRSVMHDVADSRAVAERALPAGTVKVHPEASHAISGERPAGIAADLAAFLNAI